MAFDIRQMISGLFANSESESPVSPPLAPQKSLLDKLGAVFNFSGAATTNNNSSRQNAALRNVSTQVDLSNTEIKNQLRREAVRNGFDEPKTASKDNSGFYLAGGYRLFPEEIYVTPQMKQSEVMKLAYGGFADKAKLSEAGAREFIERRMADTGGKICPPNRPDVPYSDTEFAAQTVTGKISIYANDTDAALLKEIKTREQAALEPDAPSISPRNTTTVGQITNTITQTLEAATGNEADSIGGTLNRIGISTLHVAGDLADVVGATDAAETLHNANSDLTYQEQATKAAIKESDYNVPTVAKIAQEAENTPEFLHDVVEGATLGDFSEKETYGVQAGKIIGGLHPAGDARDIVANTKNVAENKPGSYVGLGASLIGAIPVAGDIAKPIIKGEKKVITEVIEDALKTESKEVAEQVGKQEVEKLAKAEAEKIAKEEVEKAAKVEAERIAKEAAQINTKYDEISQNGHAVQRHGEAITEPQLNERAMHGKDPITGTTDDAFREDSAGNPLPHRTSKDATKFNSKEALVKANDYVRSSKEYKDSLAEAERLNEPDFVVKDIKLEDIYGTDYKDQVFGKTRTGTKNNPTGSVETDFTDGTIKAVYVKDSKGNWILETAFPVPKN